VNGAFRFLTAGESHGRALGVIIEGVPAGLPLTGEEIAADLARRQRGYGRGARQQIEHDRAEILSGVRHGRTLGSPILLLIPNRDAANWGRVMQVEPLADEELAELAAQAAAGNRRALPVTRVRPGHADLAGALKYGFGDVRNVLERASARETAARVAAGAVARAFLRQLGITVWSFTAEVGGVAVDPSRCVRSPEELEASPLRCPDPQAEAEMVARIDEARSRGDSVGGVFQVVAEGVPPGLGSYVHWDRRLDAALAAAIMSINIVKGVEIGLGFEQTRRFGSAVHDVILGRTAEGRWIHRTNHAGGLTGGVSNGEPIVVRGAVKPISTLARPLPSADLLSGQPVPQAHYERSDISVVPAAGVVGEAMVCLTLARFAMEKFGGDSLEEVLAALERYRERLARPPQPPALLALVEAMTGVTEAEPETTARSGEGPDARSGEGPDARSGEETTDRFGAGPTVPGGSEAAPGESETAPGETRPGGDRTHGPRQARPTALEAEAGSGGDD
jgi:chorismate synthase